MIKLKFPKTHTPIVDMDLWEMFLDALEENEVSYTADQLDTIHQHITELQDSLEAA
jgi:hypothetical protein